MIYNRAGKQLKRNYFKKFNHFKFKKFRNKKQFITFNPTKYITGKLQEQKKLRLMKNFGKRR